jgi:hypothetical protein
MALFQLHTFHDAETDRKMSHGEKSRILKMSTLMCLKKTTGNRENLSKGSSYG